MHRLTAVSLCFVFVASMRISAQNSDAGTVAFPLLNLGYDARSVGMAGASAAMPNDLYGIFTNPAALGYIHDREAFVGYRPVFMDVWGSPLVYAQPYGKDGNFAIDIVAFTLGKIDDIELNQSTGNVGPTGLVAQSNFFTGGLSWGRLFFNDAVSVGATVKGIYSSMGVGSEYYSADGLAVDAGMQYRLMGDRLIYGLAFRNFGFMRSAYTPDGDKFPLPACVEIGFSYVPLYIPSMRIALDLNKHQGDYLNYEPGIELNVYKKIFVLRGGYSFSEQDLEAAFQQLEGTAVQSYTKSNWSGVCVGAGVNAAMESFKLRLDLGLQFDDGSDLPATVLSALVDF